MPLHLMRPEWLWLLLPAGLLALLLWRGRQHSGGWRNVIDPQLLPYLVSPQQGKRGPTLLPLVCLGWVLAAVAASGPSWEKLPQPVHRKQDALVIVLDLSYSMKAADLAPSRTDRARQKILDLLAQRREGQTALVAYAGDAHVVTPLTDDIPTIANLLPALEPGMMPVPGSEPGAAIALAQDLLHSAGIRQGRILLITDGVDPADRREVERALDGGSAELAIMGVGTSTGAPVPLPDGGFLKEADGSIVMPGLDASGLQALAAATGGRYATMQVGNGDLEALLAQPLVPLADATVELDRTADAWEDQGYLFLLPLLPLVLGLFRRGWVVCLLPLVFLSQPRPAAADGWEDLWLTPDQQGQRALQQNDNERAADLFENPYWAGTAAYRAEDYESAIERFSLGADADAWYNRGNALARAGKLDEAIEAYRESLALAPGRADAQENLELLERLRQQQQEQQRDQQQKEDGNQQQEQQSQQQNQGQNQDQDQDQDQQQSQQQNQQQSRSQQAGGDQAQREQQQQDPWEQQGQQQEQQQQAAAEEPEPDAEPDSEQEQRETAGQPPDAAQASDPSERERDQAMEQWLRRVPDDPSGLLREKFRYESYQRQQQGERSVDEKVW